MRYTGIQPQYFPRLHYFSRILNSDIFSVRDDCQYVKKHKYPDGKNGKSYQADTPILQSNGLFFLSVPVKHQGLHSLANTLVSYENSWDQNQLATLKFNYQKSPFFEENYNEIKLIFEHKFEKLSELNLTTTLWGIARLLGQNVSLEDLKLENMNSLLSNQKKFRLKKIVLATDLPIVKNFEKLTADEKIIELIKYLGADEDYCGGTAHKAYMDEDLYKKNNIKVTIQNWTCREYPQISIKHPDFIPNLSIIDLLMNVQTDDALKILQE